MSSEQAQRLVALSLSKIQNARGRKTGLNLHRSLLVSSVLFKAKTAIIMAKYNMKSEYESIEDSDEVEYEENNDQQVPDIDDGCESDDESELSMDNESTDLKEDSCESDDKENNPPKVSSSQWQENNVLSDVSCKKDIVLEEKSDVRCNKCVKRRLTEVESAVESITKKQCTDSDNCQPDTTTHQPMECVQITNLVDSFHCGFSGLLSENQAHNTSEEPRAQGLSEAFNSCSTQIKDALAVASPILLSV